MLCISISQVKAWGFFAHKKINRQAIFSLPPEMIGFYKENIEYLTENAVNPDKRRYAIIGEAEKHYLDIDAYGDSAVLTLPKFWHQALEKYTEKELREHGILPWNVYHVKIQLTEAFKKRDKKAILRLSADLGHYIGDLNVPLHTTKNYNGQLTDQYGIHGLWESRIPELFAENYDFFVGKAEYHFSPQLSAWNALTQAHFALDSVLSFEKILNKNFPKDKKYSFEERGGVNTKVYSQAFSSTYHQMLKGQVERQMKAAIKLAADFWFTAWVDAGQPDLSSLKDGIHLPDTIEEYNPQLKTRPHEDYSSNKPLIKHYAFFRSKQEHLKKHKPHPAKYSFVYFF
jgi:hypothetical protein